MKSNILFTTDSGNKYFFNRKHQNISLLHPILYYLLEMDNKNIDLRTWFNSIDTEYINVYGIGKISKSDIEYYLKKYEFLKKHGQLDNFNFENHIKFDIDEKQIKHFIANSLDVAFEVTENCNLDCTYCIYKDMYEGYTKRENISLSFKKAKKLLDFLFEMSEKNNMSYIKELDIGFYGGEPLLNFSLIEQIVKYALNVKLKRTKVAFSMTTNATLLNKYIEFLVKYDFSLLLSLDGNKKNNSYRKYKNGLPSYSTVYDNIKKIQEKYPDFYDKNIQFNTVLHNRNETKELYEYFDNNFGKIPTIIEVSDDGLRNEKRHEYENMHNEFNENLNNIKIATKNLELLLPSSLMVTEFLIQNNGKVYSDYNELLVDNKIEKRYPTGTCLPFTKKLFLTAKGYLLACENVPHKFKLGTVTNESVLIDYSQISDIYRSNYQRIFKQCKYCYNQRDCSICFMQLKKDDYKVCNSFSNYKSYSNYLAFIQNKIENKPLLYINAMEKVTIS